MKFYMLRDAAGGARLLAVAARQRRHPGDRGDRRRGQGVLHRHRPYGTGIDCTEQVGNKGHVKDVGQRGKTLVMLGTD
jgi:hypothetical protein